MDFSDREKLLRRISSRNLYGSIEYHNQKINVIIQDPSLEILTHSDFIYQEKYDKEKKDGDIITLEESYRILKIQDKWSDYLESELLEIPKDIKILTEKLNILGFQKAEKKIIEKTIEKRKKRLEELNNIKNQLWEFTLEAQCLKRKRHFLISKCTKGVDLQLLESPSILNLLANLYYVENRVTLEQIRSLARNDPWRLYWAMSKNTGNQIFPCSLCEMTEFQYALCSWSRQYDFAFESTNRPDEFVINNDILFDSWYEKEVNRIEKEINKSKIDSSINNQSGSEIYLMADNEGYKDVYELNNETTRRIISDRETAINSSTELKEAELPDVKQTIQMQINNMRKRN